MIIHIDCSQKSTKPDLRKNRFLGHNLQFGLHRVMSAFSRRCTILILDFVEFIGCLSVTTRGTLMEQIKWIFDLYDINRDGVIEIEEIQVILDSVGALGIDKNDPDNIIAKFNEMDEDSDGLLSQSEFVNGCLEDTSLLKAIGLMK